jgi:hypothetical protein
MQGKFFFTASFGLGPVGPPALLGLLGLLACGGIRTDDAREIDRSDAPEVALARAREAQADVYAPALYGAAVDALERGETTEETDGTVRAELLASRAAEEAIGIRDEAKRAAELSLRDAQVLLSVVEAVLSHQPTSGTSLPTAARVTELRVDLARASQAYEAGDFAIAGHLAQDAATELAGSASTSGIDGRDPKVSPRRQ